MPQCPHQLGLWFQELPEWIAVGLINLWVLSQSTVVFWWFFVDIIRQSSSSLLLKALESFVKSIFLKLHAMLRWICRSFSYVLLRIPIFDCSQFQFFVLQIYMFVGDFPMFLVGATDYWVILGYWTLSTAQFPHIAWWIMVNLPSGKLT